jgi:hypothetical protein
MVEPACNDARCAVRRWFALMAEREALGGTMPSKHRPTPDIPSSLGFLIRPWWLPFLLFWVLTLGVAYLVWLLK